MPHLKPCEAVLQAANHNFTLMRKIYFSILPVFVELSRWRTNVYIRGEHYGSG